MRWLAAVVMVTAALSSCHGTRQETCDAPPPQLLGGGCDFNISMGVADDGVYWVNPCGSMVLHASAPDAVTVVLRGPALGQVEAGPLLVTPTDFYVRQNGLVRFSRANGSSSVMLSVFYAADTVAITNGELVWGTPDGVNAMPLGGGPQRALVSGTRNPHGLLADPARQRAYWLDIGLDFSMMSVESVSLAGSELLAMDMHAFPFLMQQDDSFLYWPVQGGIQRARKELNAAPESIVQDLPAEIRAMGVTPEAIFVAMEGYSTQELFGSVFHQASIRRFALDGTPQETVSCDAEDVLHVELAEHDGNLYWLGSRGVWTVPIR